MQTAFTSFIAVGVDPLTNPGWIAGGVMVRLVDLYTFFHPPVPYTHLFPLTAQAPTLHSEGEGDAINEY